MITQENMYRLLSIDAWRNEDGWTWNNWYTIEEDIYLGYPITNRKLLAFCRRNRWLSEESKGKLIVEDDGYNIVILTKGTKEPLYAFEPQWEV